MAHIKHTHVKAAWPLLGLVVGFGLYDVVYIIVYVFNHLKGSSPLPFGDFFAFWSFSRFSHERPVETIYNTAELLQFQHGLSADFTDFYPFPYPPIFLLFLWPLGFLSYSLACLAWIGTTFVAYVAALRSWGLPPLSLWLAILAPTTLLALISGQNGFLTAALVIGGARLLATRPALAGMAFGCLAFKPQFAMLIPIVLLAIGQWRALAGMILSALTLFALSMMVFGSAIWLDWLHAIPALWHLFEANRVKLSPLMPTVTISALASGLRPVLVQLLQALVSVIVVLCLILMFRKGKTVQGAPRRLDWAALMVGIFLATPYAFIYDMPVMGAAIAGLLDTRVRQAWRPGEPIVILTALVLPLLMFSGLVTGWPLPPLVLMLLFGVILRAGWSMGSDYAPAYLLEKSRRTPDIDQTTPI